MDVVAVAFYVFAGLLLGSAAMVVFARNAVSGVLSLIVSFIASTGLWLLLHAEFLALALLFVYVGAVMTLFLFTVMMLNISLASHKARLLRRFPMVLLLGGILVALLWVAIGPDHFGLTSIPGLAFGSEYNNTKALGVVLYTDYVVPLELAAVILLVAMVSAIGLTFRGHQARRAQNVPTQIMADKASRLQLVDLPSEHDQSEQGQPKQEGEG